MVPPSWWTPTTLLVDAAPPVLERMKGAVCSKEGLCTRCKCDKEDAARRLEVRLRASLTKMCVSPIMGFRGGRGVNLCSG